MAIMSMVDRGDVFHCAGVGIVKRWSCGDTIYQELYLSGKLVLCTGVDYKQVSRRGGQGYTIHVNSIQTIYRSSKPEPQDVLAQLDRAKQEQILSNRDALTLMVLSLAWDEWPNRVVQVGNVKAI